MAIPFDSIEFFNGHGIKSMPVNGKIATLEAYDVDGASYKTFATLTSANTPTLDISAPSGGALSGNFSTLKIGGVDVVSTTASQDITNKTLISPTFVNPSLGTPFSGDLTSCTDLPIETGVSGLASGIATFLSDTTSANLKSAMTDETGTGSLVFANTPTLVTPVLGAATGTSISVTGAITSSGTAGIGYTTGAGASVTQATSKTTGVQIDKATGKITMHNESLASATTVTFTVTNSTVAVTDTISISIVSGEATDGSYQVLPAKVAAGSFKITIWNITSGALAEALVLQFNVHKGAIS